MNTKTSEQWAIELGRNACDDPFCWNQAIAESMVDKIREQAIREAAEVAELSLETKEVRYQYAVNCSTVPRDAILSLIDRKEGCET